MHNPRNSSAGRLVKIGNTQVGQDEVLRQALLDNARDLEKNKGKPKEEPKEDPKDDPKEEPKSSLKSNIKKARDPNSKEGEGDPDLENDFEGLNVSEAIKLKFKRHKQEAKAIKEEADKARAEAEELRKALEEAKATATATGSIEDREEYKKLKEEHEKAQDLVGKLSLQEDPRFKQKYEAKAMQLIGDAIEAISSGSDPDAANETQAALSAALSIPFGVKNEVDFNRKLIAVLANSGLDDISRGEVARSIKQARKLMEERANELGNWKSAREEIDGIDSKSRLDAAKLAEAAFEKVQATFDAENAERTEWVRKNDKAIGYTETVDSFKKKAKEEISKSSRTGVVTPGLIELVHLGTEAPFMAKMNQSLNQLLKELAQERDELKGKLEKIRGGSPAPGGGKKPAADDGEEELSLKDRIKRARAMSGQD